MRKTGKIMNVKPKREKSNSNTDLLLNRKFDNTGERYQNQGFTHKRQQSDSFSNEKSSVPNFLSVLCKKNTFIIIGR